MRKNIGASLLVLPLGLSLLGPIPAQSAIAADSSSIRQPVASRLTVTLVPTAASVSSSDHDKVLAWVRADGLTKLQAVEADLKALQSQISQGNCTKLAADASAVAATTGQLPASVGMPLNYAMSHLEKAGRACASGDNTTFANEFAAAIPDFQKALSALKAIK